METIVFRDFQPVNQWTEDPIDNGYLVDSSTGRRYWNEPARTVRIKCLLLTAATPIVHTALSVINIAYRVLKLITFAHLWEQKHGESSSLKERAKAAGKDLLRVIASPLAFAGLQLSAVYGLLSPYDGRKLYATIERAQYSEINYAWFFVPPLAPCFQPNPTRHLFSLESQPGHY